MSRDKSRRRKGETYCRGCWVPLRLPYAQLARMKGQRYSCLCRACKRDRWRTGPEPGDLKLWWLTHVVR